MNLSVCESNVTEATSFLSTYCVSGALLRHSHHSRYERKLEFRGQESRGWNLGLADSGARAQHHSAASLGLREEFRGTGDVLQASVFIEVLSWRGELSPRVMQPLAPRLPPLPAPPSFSLSDSISALCPANSEAGGRVHS